MKRKIFIPLLAFLFILPCIAFNNKPPAVNAEEAISGEGIVNVEDLKLRNDPDTSSEIKKVLSKGDKITIKGKEGEWLKVKAGSETGWVFGSYVDVPKTEKKTDVPYVTLTASLTAKDSPSSSGKSAADLNKGETYEITGEENAWIKIRLSKDKQAWIPSWFTQRTEKELSKVPEDSRIVILYDDAPLREAASLDAPIKKEADSGDEFKVTGIVNGMYEVKRSFGRKAYIAGWLAEPIGENPVQLYDNQAFDLKNKTIIIDPGHGGNDSGTIGENGTLEKDLTFYTARLLARKLEASGATVIVTRSDDTYISLTDRVKLSHLNRADAFISLHYDSAEQATVKGITTYYYHNYQIPLAKALSGAFEDTKELQIRAARFGDYHVLRSNSMPAILLELGYLSNAEEEELITSLEYQATIVQAIYNGLGGYFNP